MATRGNWENTSGLGVQAHYGARATGDAGGHINTDGTIQELRFVIDGTMVSNQTMPLVRTRIPAGAKVIDVALEVSTAFALGGTTPTLLVGTDGSEATNGVSFSEAQAEAVNTYVVTSFNGTWANRLAAETLVNIAMGGTTPTSTSAGVGTIVVRYRHQ